jgi:hypothetical protein
MKKKLEEPEQNRKVLHDFEEQKITGRYPVFKPVTLSDFRIDGHRHTSGVEKSLYNETLTRSLHVYKSELVPVWNDAHGARKYCCQPGWSLISEALTSLPAKYAAKSGSPSQGNSHLPMVRRTMDQSASD